MMSEKKETQQESEPTNTASKPKQTESKPTLPTKPKRFTAKQWEAICSGKSEIEAFRE